MVGKAAFSGDSQGGLLLLVIDDWAQLRELLDDAADGCRPWDGTQFYQAWTDEIWRLAEFICDRLAAKTACRYPWIDRDDLRQNMLLKTEHFAQVYDPLRSDCFSKHVYWKFGFYVKDVLRREDPVGIKYPQREHYPTWFRLGAMDGTQEDGNESQFGADYDGRQLEGSLEDIAEAIEQRQWLADFEAVNRLLEGIRQSNRLPSLVEVGCGVARAAKLEHWDKKKNRCRFRLTKNRFVDFIKRRRSKKLYVPSLPAQPPSEPNLQQEQPTTTEPTTQEHLTAALESAGRAGATTEVLAKTTGRSKYSVQSALLRMRRAGLIYVVGHLGHKKELYALAKLFPDGPPIPQVSTKPKAKPKPKHKPTAKPIQKNPLPAIATPKPKIDPTDLMLVVTALAGVKNEALKSRLLAVLAESVNG